MPRFLTVTAILLATINAFAGVSYSFRTDTKGLYSFSTSGTAASDGNNLRMNFARGDRILFGDGSVVISTDGGKTIAVLSPKAKTYYVLPVEEMAASALGSVETSSPSVKITNAGDGGKIEGMDTRHVLIEISYEIGASLGAPIQMKISGEAWVTDAIPAGPASFVGTRGFHTSNRAIDALIEAQGTALHGAFALREKMTLSVTGGLEMASSTTASVSNVKVRDIPASEFAIPKGYVKVESPLDRLKKLPD